MIWSYAVNDNQCQQETNFLPFLIISAQSMNYKPTLLVSLGYQLEMQNLGPYTPDLMNQNLYFNKKPQGFNTVDEPP